MRSKNHRRRTACEKQLLPSRRDFLTGAAGTAAALGLGGKRVLGQIVDRQVNLAKLAIPSNVVTTSENKISALNYGFDPASSRDRAHRTYAVRAEPELGNENQAGQSLWIQYEWPRPVAINKMDIYWAIDPLRPKGLAGTEFSRLAAPASYRILYWDGNNFVPVSAVMGLGTSADIFNLSGFDVVKTLKLRVEIVSDGEHAAGILEWRVFNAGPIPSLPPVVHAGVDRLLVIGGQTYLMGTAIWLQDSPANTTRWSKLSGPGSVSFGHPTSPVTTATFSAPLKMAWRPDLLGGVMTMTGQWKDGTTMLAVPNYARINRVGPPREYPGDEGINYAPGATTST